jgi:uncharacterized protein YcfJ
MLITTLALLFGLAPIDQTSSTVPCVGLMLPSVRGADGDATATATSLRELLTSYLAGPKLRVVQIDARLAVQAIEEAREKDCGQVLVLTLTRKRNEGSGVGKALGRAASGAAWYVPYGGSGATAAVRGAAIAGAYAVSELAGSTRAKDEMTIEYGLARPGSAGTSPKRESLKAKADREDLVTPLAERVAEAVVLTVAK